MVPLLHQAPRLQGQPGMRAGPLPPPQPWPYGTPSAEVNGGWELAKQAQGTGLGPDNPRSKQPVSSVSWEAAKTSYAGSFISPLAREPGPGEDHGSRKLFLEGQEGANGALARGTLAPGLSPAISRTAPGFRCPTFEFLPALSSTIFRLHRSVCAHTIKVVFLCRAIPALHSSLSHREDGHCPQLPANTHTQICLSHCRPQTTSFLPPSFVLIPCAFLHAHVYTHTHTHTLTPARVPISKPASTGIIHRQLPMKTIKKKKLAFLSVIMNSGTISTSWCLDFFFSPFKVLTLSFAAGRNPATVLAPAVASVSWVAHSWPVSNASMGAQWSQHFQKGRWGEGSHVPNMLSERFQKLLHPQNLELPSLSLN